jgi:hypothetical protein
MARGQSGSLLLSLYDSFIHYFTPVYPDAIHAEVSDFARQIYFPLIQ